MDPRSDHPWDVTLDYQCYIWDNDDDGGDEDDADGDCDDDNGCVVVDIDNNGMKNRWRY